MSHEGTLLREGLPDARVRYTLHLEERSPRGDFGYATGELQLLDEESAAIAADDMAELETELGDHLEIRFSSELLGRGGEFSLTHRSRVELGLEENRDDDRP